MLRRIIVTLSILTLVVGLTAGVTQRVYAVDVLDPVCNADNLKNKPGGTPTVCKDAQAANKSDSNPLVGPGGLLTRYIQILAIVVGLGAVVVIMLAGLRFITSSGEAQAVSSARSTILYACVGLVVAAFAQIMVTFVISRL
jgi:hypothetical protein